MDRGAFDELMASDDPAMAVVTVAAGGERSGCLVGFHGQSSIEPPRYCVWLSKANHTYGVALEATHVAVHFLTAGDHELARIFGSLTGDEVDKFDLVEWHPGPDGVPLLDGCPHGLAGAKDAVLDAGGDHVMVAIDPTSAWTAGSFTPLRLSDVTDVEPGHPAD